jgi:hypothetical protein
MTRVYLWDAGDAVGVTDDLETACRRVADSLRADGVPAAVVEPAWFDDGASTMGSGYVRSKGPYLTAYLRAGRVVWSGHGMLAAEREPLRAAS